MYESQAERNKQAKKENPTLEKQKGKTENPTLSDVA